MTKEEKAADDYAVSLWGITSLHSPKDRISEEGFMAGIKWRDENPKNVSKCVNCGKLEGVHLITVTDHPDTHDGIYCTECNPWGGKTMTKEEGTAERPMQCMIMQFRTLRECETWIEHMIQAPNREIISVQYQHSHSATALTSAQTYSAMVLYKKEKEHD